MRQSFLQYRGFVMASILNEFKLRFARSKLGAFWMVLQPLSQVLMYTIILSTVMQAKLPNINQQHGYALYLMSGTLAWSLFYEIVTRCLTLFIDKANLIKKIQFPRAALFWATVGSALMSHGMLLGVMLVIFSSLGAYPHVALCELPFLMILLVMFSLGVGLCLGILNVFMRDLTHMVPILLQLLFWATPIVYPMSVIPEHWQSYFKLNPLTWFAQAYQQLFLQGVSPVLSLWCVMLMVAVSAMCMGLWMFHRASPEMVDVL